MFLLTSQLSKSKASCFYPMRFGIINLLCRCNVPLVLVALFLTVGSLGLSEQGVIAQGTTNYDADVDAQAILIKTTLLSQELP